MAFKIVKTTSANSPQIKKVVIKEVGSISVTEKPVDIEKPQELKVPTYHGGGKFGQLVVEAPVEPKTQSQTKVQEATAVEVTETEALVNEYIILDQKYTEFEGDKIAKRMTELKKILQSIANDTMAPEELGVVYGTIGELVFSKRIDSIEFPQESKEILIKHLLGEFGPEVLAQVAKLGVTDLRKVLSENEIENFAQHVWGARTLK